ncbi:MAG: transporter substrate-binding domain-containing protein [Candidatus Thorarchaeota archaeon]|nr:transporter substrate-binding domain-containing protein [Candidatus Thorarchaeota archaeon]
MNVIVNGTRLTVFGVVLLFRATMLTSTVTPVPVRAAEAWTVALDEAYAPHEYWENESAKGFNTDVIRYVAESMSRDVVWVPLPWAKAYQALQNGTVESLCMARTPQRELIFDFSQPIMNLTLRVFVRGDVSGIIDISELANRTVAVEADDICESKLNELCPDAVVVRVDSQAEAIRLVAEGEVTAAFCNRYAGAYAIIEHSYSDIKMVAQPIDGGIRCIAVAKGNLVLLGSINAGLNEMVATGEYDRVLEKWFGAYPFAEENQLMLRAAMVTSFVALLAVFGIATMATWNRSLSRRVNHATSKLALLGDLFRHDLRNIGQCMYTSLELVADETTDESTKESAIQTALSAVQRAERLTSDFSMVESMTAGKHPLVETPLKTILVSALAEVALEGGATFEFESQDISDTNVIAVSALKEAITRVMRFMVNLANSSIAKVPISVAVSLDRDWATLVISSKVVCIPDDVKEGLLRRYLGVRTPVVGLDLSIVHAIVTASRGLVTIENIVPGDWRKGVAVKMLLRIPHKRIRMPGFRMGSRAD